MGKQLVKPITGFLIILLMITAFGKNVQASDEASQTLSMTIDAVVSEKTGDYTIEIPESINFGTLNYNEDNTFEYSVKSKFNNSNANQNLTVSLDSEFLMYSDTGEDTLTCYNVNKNMTISGSEGSAYGVLKILKEDISKVTAGNYTGTMNFTITYTKNGSTQSTSSFKDGSSSLKTNISNAQISNLSNYATNHKGYEYTFSIDYASANENNTGYAKIAELISASQKSGFTTYYDFSLIRTDENDSQEYVEDTEDYVLTITLPIENYSSSNTVDSVYRYHGGQAYKLTELSALPSSPTDGTYYVSGSYVYIYTSKFSTYGVFQTPVTTSSTSSTTTTSSMSDGTYKATLTMKTSSSFSTTSMCNALFHNYADIVVSSGSAKITFYVIDPVPNYSSDGTPISNLKLTYNGTTYSASIDSTNKVVKEFEYSAAFIPTAGGYKASVITVTLPSAAIEASQTESTGILCSAYVTTMKTTQQFYAVFSDVQTGSTTTTTEVTTTTTTSTSSVAAGTYKLPVTAIKEKTTDTSMLADYMYPYADLVVATNSYKLTLYIQHTVAGIDGGGPKYLKTASVEAAKTENAVTLDGVVYDSFTFNFTSEPSSPLLLKMFINAVSMEVNSRLVFNYSQAIANASVASNSQATTTNTSSTAKTTTNTVTTSKKTTAATSSTPSTKEISASAYTNNEEAADTDKTVEIIEAESDKAESSAEQDKTVKYKLGVKHLKLVLIILIITLSVVTLLTWIIIQKKRRADHE